MSMTDAELLAKTVAARGSAHRALGSQVSRGHTGILSISSHSDAACTRAHEFADLWAECRKRGLKMPACDCPAGSHEE